MSLSGTFFYTPTETRDFMNKVFRKDWIVVVFSAMALQCAMCYSCWGQGGAGDQVVELIDGIQYEGRLFEIPGYSETAFTMNPFTGGNQIVGIDDGLRTVLIAHYKIKGTANSLRNEIQFTIPQREYRGDQGVGLLLRASPFNEFGHREFMIRQNNAGRMVDRTYIQGITKINPRYCQANTLMGGQVAARRWEMSLKTSTIPKNVLRGMLINRLGGGKVSPNDLYDISDFFRQAGDFKQANEEYIQLAKQFPDQKERVRELRMEVDQLIGRQVLSEIRTRIQSGQPRLGFEFANAKDLRGLAFDIQAEYKQIQDDFSEQQNTVRTTRQKVLDLIASVNGLNQNQQQAVQRFVDEINTDLNPDNLARLDAYLLTADAGNAVPANNLAKALSGWLVGSNRAEPNLAVASTMYRTRDLVMEYLQTVTTETRRTQILEELEGLETGKPQYIDALLKNAKPVEAVDLTNYDGSKPIEFWVEFEGTKKRPQPWRFRCLAHLPPEYNPYRKYPMILTLCDGGGIPLERFLNVWTGSHNQALSSKLGLAVRNGHAMRNGYIVVAVDWRAGNQSKYNHSAREHRTVSEALYHSLRKFSVNSDRVFLAGHGEGGTAATDIALAHPEHFAGVISYSGEMGMYTDHYIDNKHINLRMYCVLGSKDFAGRRSYKNLAERCLKSKKFNELTMVHYNGRPKEYFQEDIPEVFKWMEGPSRRWPDKTGFEFECRVLRNCDCYFWFWEMDGVPDKYNIDPVMFTRTKSKVEMTLSGEIKANNVFKVGPINTTNIRNKTTLWLSPEYFDFSKRLVIQGRAPQKMDVVASNKTLLDDTLRRGDTKHIFWAGVEFVDGKWRMVDEE